MKLVCSILIAIVAIIGYFIVDLVIVSNALKTFNYFGNEGFFSFFDFFKLCFKK